MFSRFPCVQTIKRYSACNGERKRGSALCSRKAKYFALKVCCFAQERFQESVPIPYTLPPSEKFWSSLCFLSDTEASTTVSVIEIEQRFSAAPSTPNQRDPTKKSVPIVITTTKTTEEVPQNTTVNVIRSKLDKGMRILHNSFRQNMILMCCCDHQQSTKTPFCAMQMWANQKDWQIS